MHRRRGRLSRAQGNRHQNQNSTASPRRDPCRAEIFREYLSTNIPSRYEAPARSTTDEPYRMSQSRDSTGSRHNFSSKARRKRSRSMSQSPGRFVRHYDSPGRDRYNKPYVDKRRRMGSSTKSRSREYTRGNTTHNRARSRSTRRSSASRRYGASNLGSRDHKWTRGRRTNSRSPVFNQSFRSWDLGNYNQSPDRHVSTGLRRSRSNSRSPENNSPSTSRAYGHNEINYTHSQGQEWGTGRGRSRTNSRSPDNSSSSWSRIQDEIRAHVNNQLTNTSFTGRRTPSSMYNRSPDYDSLTSDQSSDETYYQTSDEGVVRKRIRLKTNSRSPEYNSPSSNRTRDNINCTQPSGPGSISRRRRSKSMSIDRSLESPGVEEEQMFPEPISIESFEALPANKTGEFIAAVLNELVSITLGRSHSTPGVNMHGFEAHLRQRGIQFDSSKSFKIIMTALPDFFRISSNSCVIEARTNVKICEKYTSNVNIKDCGCKELHVCKFYLTGRCLAEDNCKFNHDMMLPHNQSVLKHHFLHKMSPEFVGEIIWDINNRNSTTSPTICKFYNNEGGCNKARCQHLHICLHFVKRNCKFKSKCKRYHHFKSEQSRELLYQYGLSNYENELNVLFRLLENNLKDGTIKTKKSIELKNKSAARLFKKFDGKNILCEKTDENVKLGNVRKHIDEKETSAIESSNWLPIESNSQMEHTFPLIASDNDIDDNAVYTENDRYFDLGTDAGKAEKHKKHKNKKGKRSKHKHKEIKKESENLSKDTTVEIIYNRKCQIVQCNETCENLEDDAIHVPTAAIKNEPIEDPVETTVDEKETSAIESSNWLPIESNSQMEHTFLLIASKNDIDDNAVDTDNVRYFHLGTDEGKAEKHKKHKNKKDKRSKHKHKEIKKESENFSKDTTVETIYNRKCQIVQCNETCENLEDDAIHVPTAAIKNEPIEDHVETTVASDLPHMSTEDIFPSVTQDTETTKLQKTAAKASDVILYDLNLVESDMLKYDTDELSNAENDPKRSDRYATEPFDERVDSIIGITKEMKTKEKLADQVSNGSREVDGRKEMSIVSVAKPNDREYKVSNKCEQMAVIELTLEVPLDDKRLILVREDVTISKDQLTDIDQIIHSNTNHAPIKLTDIANSVDTGVKSIESDETPIEYGESTIELHKDITYKENRVDVMDTNLPGPNVFTPIHVDTAELSIDNEKGPSNDTKQSVISESKADTCLSGTSMETDSKDVNSRYDDAFVAEHPILESIEDGFSVKADQENETRFNSLMNYSNANVSAADVAGQSLVPDDADNFERVEICRYNENHDASTNQAVRNIDEALDTKLQHQDFTTSHDVAGLKNREYNAPLKTGQSADSIQLEITQSQNNSLPIITHVTKTEEQNNAPLEDSGSMDGTKTQEEIQPIGLKLNDITEMNADTFENQEHITQTLESADDISDELAERSHTSSKREKKIIQISVDDNTYYLSFEEDTIEIECPGTTKEVLMIEEIKNKVKLSTSGLLEALEQFEAYRLSCPKCQ